MNKYLSTVGLYARWNLYRILVITLVTAALAGVLVWRYPVGTVVLDENYVNPKTGETTTLVASYPRLVSVAAESRATVVCAVGFAAIVVTMSLTGCGLSRGAAGDLLGGGGGGCVRRHDVAAPHECGRAAVA